MMKQFGRSIQFACIALLVCAAFVLGQPKKQASKSPEDLDPKLKSTIERILAKAKEGVLLAKGQKSTISINFRWK